MSKARDLANIISGSGTLNANVIPNLPTSKITSGTFDDARLSSSSVTQHVDLSNLNASNLTSGSVPSARLSLSASDIPNLSASKITADTLGEDRIPALPTSKITSGTFDDARLSSSSVTQHVDLSNLSASNLTSGTIPNARYGTPTFSASNLTSLPAPTNSQILTGVASASSGAVGSYAFASQNNNGTNNSNSSSHHAPGSTHGGSGIIYCNAHSHWYGAAGSGTWRCMGYGYQNGKHTKATVYMRIS